MQIIDRELSNRISWASFIGACLIVLHHVPISRTEGSSFYHAVLSIHHLCLIGVPLFFAISGFLFVGRCEESGWWKVALKKRCVSLLIPYVVINLFYVPFVWIYHNSSGSAFHSEMVYTLSIKTLLTALGLVLPANPACNPLWFVRFLFVLMIVSPVIVLIIRKNKVLARLFVGAMFLLMIFMPRFGIPDEVLSYRGIAFFSAGIYYRIYGLPDMRKANASAFLATSIFFAILSTNGIFCQYGKWIVSIMGVIGLFYSARDLPEVPKIVANSSFSIYVLHIILMYGLRIGLKILGMGHLIYTVFGACVFLFLPIGIGCFAHYYIEKRSRILSMLLFGGR